MNKNLKKSSSLPGAGSESELPELVTRKFAWKFSILFANFRSAWLGELLLVLVQTLEIRIGILSEFLFHQIWWVVNENFLDLVHLICINIIYRYQKNSEKYNFDVDLYWFFVSILAPLVWSLFKWRGKKMQNLV